jgi:outer membrane protein assembly complex protein YaeT
VQRTVERSLSERLRGEVRFGSFEVDWLRLEARFRNARVDLTTPSGETAAARVDAGRMSLSWAAIPGLATGSVRISTIEIDRPAVRMGSAFLRDWSPAPSGGADVEIRLDRVSIDGGSIEWVDASTDAKVDAHDLRLEGTWSTARRALVGEFSTRASVSTRVLAAPLVLWARGAFIQRPGFLELHTVRASAPGASIEGSVRAKFQKGATTWNGSAEIEADAASIGSWFSSAAPPFAGRLHASTTIRRGPGEVFRIDGRVSAREAGVGRLLAASLDAEMTVDPAGAEFREVRGALLGGSVEGGLRIPFGAGRGIDADVRLRRIEGRLLAAVAGRPLPLDAWVDADVRVSIPRAAFDSWTGAARVTASPGVGRGVPFGGVGELVLATGRLRGQGVRVVAPSLEGTVDFDVPLRPSGAPARFAWRTRTADAGPSQRAVLTLLEALGLELPSWIETPVAGRGAVDGAVALGGTAAWEIRLDLEGGSWGEDAFDRAGLAVRRSGDVLEIADGRFERGEESLRGSARFGMAPFELLSVDADAVGVRAGPLVARWAGFGELEGRLSGELSLLRANGGLGGGGSFRLENGFLWGEPFDLVRGEILAADGRFDLVGGALEGPLLNAGFLARYEPGRETASGTVRFAGLRPGSSKRLEEAAVRLEGTWSGSGAWSWTRAEGPGARLDLEADGIGIVGILDPGNTGPAVGTLSLAGRRLELAMEEAAARAWRLEASLDFADRFPFAARLDLDRFAMEPPGLGGSGISTHLSGSTRITGFLSDLDSIALDASIEPLSVFVPGGRFDAARPVVVSLRDRKVTLERSTLVTAGANLEAAFTWDLRDDAVSGDLRGRADLSLLSLLRREIRASGQLDVDVRVSGSLAAPTLNGRATVAEGRLRWLGIRQALDGIEASVAFDGRSVRLESFRALAGGGELNGRGELTLQRAEGVRFDATVGVSEVSVEFPKGFRGLYDGALRLEGGTGASVLSGRLSLVRGLYDENFDVTRMGGQAGREIERSALEDLPSGIALDVEIEGADDVWLRNNLGRLEAGVSIRVRGEVRRPTLAGRIALFEGGRLRFRDVDYRVVAGSLEFEGDEAINPFVELRAETRVADYDVRLRIAGRLDGFEYELTSYPTLAESDIIYLLLTGEIPASSASVGGGGSTGVPGGLAADYFAGVLTAGFSRQLEKTLRLDQIQINPLLESGEDPTARVTVGKQVTDRVRILYTIDVGAVEEDTYLVEWQATRRWRLTGEQDSGGAYVATAQFTDRYGRSGAADRAAVGRDVRSQETLLLRSSEVSGVERDEARRLERKTDLESGKPIRRADLVLATEAIRKDLVRRGFLDSRVTTRVDVRNDGTGVEFLVDRGKRTELRVEGLSGRMERAVERSLREFFEEGIPGLERETEAAEIAFEELRLRGHFAADVLVRTEDLPSGDRVLRVSVDPGPPIRASKVTLDGVSRIPVDRVRKQVLTGRKEGLQSRPISPAVLEEDGRGILALYRTEGYLDARVEPPIVRLSVEGADAEIVFRVREGELRRIEAIEVVVEGPVERAEVERWSGLAVGQPASAAAWPEAARRIRAALDARGFPDARVEVRGNRTEDPVPARIEVRTGPKMIYAGAQLEGNFRTRDKIIRREIPFESGEPISSERLRELQHRLYRLGIFQDVRVGTEPAPSEGPDARRVRIAVSEAKPLSLGVGLGYDTDAGTRLSFALGHDNLGGYHRSLTFQTRWSDIEKRIQVVGRDPWLFNRRLDSTATYFWETLEENGYDLRRNSFAFRVDRRLPSNWKRFLRYNFQEVDIDIYEVTDEVIEAIREQKLQDLSLGDVGLTFARDTRDDSFLPTRGGYALGELRLFLPVFVSEESFAKVFLQGSATHTFAGGASYSVAARVGAAKTFGSTVTVPLSERYFAGGSSTLRGFERDTVGLVVEGIPLGGEAMLVLNQEIRWPIWKELQLVAFTDWGNVYTELQSFDPTDLRYTAGAGFRLATPIGPLRFEYGHKLDRREGESSGEFYFAVGTIY